MLDGFGLVALDRDVAGLDLQRVHQDPGAANDLRGTFTHQHIVAADERLAFDSVENQALGVDGPCLHQLLRGREHGAAQTGDAPLEDPPQEVRRLHGEIIGIVRDRVRGIIAVAFNHDAGRQVAVTPRNGVGPDGDHRS